MTTHVASASQPDAGIGRRSVGASAARALLLVAVVAHIVAAWLGRPPGILTGQDDAEYVILAQSLRAGGYHELHRIDAPLHSTYPPVYPAMLALWSTIAGDGFDALVMLNIALSAATLLLLRRTLLRRGFGEVVATGSAVVLAVNPALVTFAGSVRSETPYILLATCCLLLLAEDDPSTRRLAFAAAAAIVAALTRTIGVTLLAALGLCWLLEKRWKATALLAVASAATVGAWVMWTAVAPEQYLGTSYVADLRTAAGATSWSPGPLLRIPGHLAWYARIAVPWQLGIPTVRGTLIDNILVVLVLAVLGCVGAGVFLQRWRPAALYLAAYFGLLSVWVWRLERFVVPMLPILVPALLVGAHWIGTRSGLRRAWVLPAALALFLAAGAGVRTTGNVVAATRCDRSLTMPDPRCLTPDRASFFDALRWIRTNTADDDVILAAKSAPLWFYTGRRTVGYGAALTADTTTLLPFLREQGADYILLGALEQSEVWRLAPLLAGVCDSLFLKVRFSPNTYLFALEPSEPYGDACAAVDVYLRDNGDRLF